MWEVFGQMARAIARVQMRFTWPGTWQQSASKRRQAALISGVGAPLVGAPEVYIRISEDFFTEDGAIAAEGTRDFLTGFLQRLHELIRRWQ